MDSYSLGLCGLCGAGFHRVPDSVHRLGVPDYSLPLDSSVDVEVFHARLDCQHLHRLILQYS